jgi:hypothetical protein
VIGNQCTGVGNVPANRFHQEHTGVDGKDDPKRAFLRIVFGGTASASSPQNGPLSTIAERKFSGRNKWHEDALSRTVVVHVHGSGGQIGIDAMD